MELNSLQWQQAKELVKTSWKINKVLHLQSSNEWRRAKEYHLHIGKHGGFVQMINPKEMQGPAASSQYPTKPGETIQYARYTAEKKEASMQMHTKWTSNPEGNINCHFFKLTC